MFGYKPSKVIIPVVTAGQGSQSSTAFHGIGQVENAYDGRIYFVKSNSPVLYVIPNPDDPLPQDLTPHDVDYSMTSVKNLQFASNMTVAYMPENIDGFNYLSESSVATFNLSRTAVPLGGFGEVEYRQFQSQQYLSGRIGEMGIVKYITTPTRQTFIFLRWVSHHSLLTITTPGDRCAILYSRRSK